MQLATKRLLVSAIAAAYFALTLFAGSLLFIQNAFAQSTTTDATSTPATTDATPNAATPSFPSSGTGGDAATTMALLALSAAGVMGGAFILTRRAS